MDNRVSSVTVTTGNPIVKVEPFTPCIQIEWMISKRCNFDCSYCPPRWHDKTSKDLTLEELKTAWIKIIKVTEHKPQLINLSILGGEPSLNKNLLPFLKWVRENYSNNIGAIGTVTNGSAQSSFYTELVSYCNWVTFSTHSEFMNERKFFRNVIKAYKASKKTGSMIMVNLMQESWYNERIELYQKFLNKYNIANYMHQIEYSEGFNQFDGKRAEVRPVKLTKKMKFI